MIYRTDEDQNWFYVREGRREGPFDRRALIQALLALDAPESTLVWRSGLAHWTRAGELQELRLELPPPIPKDPARRETSGGTAEPPPVPGTEGAARAAESDDEEEDDEVDAPEGAATDGSPTGEGGRRRRRRRKRKHSEAGFNPRVLQLAALFLMLALVVWLLLRRMNQLPEGTVIYHGRLEAAPTETTQRAQAASTAATVFGTGVRFRGGP
jgi:hypothetical protein